MVAAHRHPFAICAPAMDAYTIGSEVSVSKFEPTVALRSPAAPESGGFLLFPLSRFMEHLSELLISDTEGLAAGPIARIKH